MSVLTTKVCITLPVGGPLATVILITASAGFESGPHSQELNPKLWKISKSKKCLEPSQATLVKRA